LKAHEVTEVNLDDLYFPLISKLAFMFALQVVIPF